MNRTAQIALFCTFANAIEIDSHELAKKLLMGHAMSNVIEEKTEA